MRTGLIKTVVTAVATVLFFAFNVPVQASEVLNPPINVAKKKKAKKSKAHGSANATFRPGSQETKKERTARLKRECKGEVNAGACTGYTR